MATRWGVPCGCILVYEMVNDAMVVDRVENRCDLHAETPKALIVEACLKYCKENAPPPPPDEEQ